MTDIAIRVENLSKLYRIGPRQRYKTLRESLTSAITSPLRRWRDRRPKTADGSLGPLSPVSGPSQSGPRSPVSGPSPDNHIWALRDVSFEVKQGEVVGIIGRNGAGKSTLLKILSRITKPTEGRAVVSGRVGSLLEVGTGFHPELTGRENIYLNGAILGMRKAEIERKFDEMVAFAEVEKFIDTPVKHYSSGMYVRLAFAVAAHLEPEILLVDEVLAVGDIAFQKKCLGKMGDVAKEGRTVLFVSHSLPAIRQLCQSGILLHDGRIVTHSHIHTVIHEYVGGVASSTGSVELTLTDHVTGLNGIRVWKATLLNGVSESFALPWKRPIHLVLQIQVTKPLRNIAFGLGITTLEGVPVLTVHNTDQGDEPVSLQPGFYRVHINVENPLRIGIYNLILGAHEAVAKTSIFYIPNAIRLEVLSSTAANVPYFEYNTGIVNGTSTWTVSAHPDSATEAPY